MSDAEWVKRIEKSPLVTELAAAKEEKVAVERAFLRSLSRLPTPAEEQMIHEHIRAARSRRDAWNDIVWALLNTRELRTNH
jgi:ribosomal protein L16/L10AE